MSDYLDQNAIDCLLHPLLYPSGVWADFTPIWTYWYAIENLVTLGRIPKELLPPKPNPADYTNYTAQRTFQMPDEGWPVTQRL